MAKDAKGHGSEAHGGSQTPVQQENAPFKSRLGGKNYLDPHDPRNVTIGGKVFPQGYDNLRARADAAAAGALASGPKSAPVPVHDSMRTGHDVMAEVSRNIDKPERGNPNYHAGAVNNAIASSNRSGRRIGGREAKMIHALLSGRR